MKALRAYVLFYPAALLLAFLATWLVGRMSLGHWPRPSLDDPKFIGGWVDAADDITGILLAVGLPVFAVAVLCLLLRAYLDVAQRRNLLFTCALSIVGMAATVLILIWDPLGIVSWYMD